MTTLIDLKNTKDRLDKVSPSFCLAKWTQVTLRLSDGFNHSCHHPSMHASSLEEIKTDPSALHNTKHKKDLRQQMINGVRPNECNYCWMAEDSGNSTVYSDRIRKSATFWSAPYYNRIVSDPMQNINPSYVEVMFNNTCNLKCSYCGPRVSSKWAEEIKQHGGYPTSDTFNGFDVSKMVKQRDDNPHTDAFWKWWPSLYKDLKVFRITGGEPLLSKHTFTTMDMIADHPKEGFSFEINTNLSVPDELVDRMIDKMKQIKADEKIIYTSCEGFGARGEYGRHGLNYDKWRANVIKVLNELPDCKLSIMSAYNLFSVTSYNEFVKDMLEIRKQSANKFSDYRVIIDVPYLRNPHFLSVFILDESFRPYIQEQVDTFLSNKFSLNEINCMKRVLSVFDTRPREGTSIVAGRKDFVKFIDEHDRRRSTDFLSTFPEMEQFYYECYSAQ